MTSKTHFDSSWGSQYRLVASEKWKAKSAAMGQPVTEALVEYSQPRVGMRVLDLSADLLEIAAKRARDRGLTNFTAQQGDAHSLPFEESSFDLATSRFGVMFFRDPELAFRELLRVLRPGARACFLAWVSFDQPYWQSTMGAVRRHVGGPLLLEGPNPFCYAEHGSLSAILRSAGFRDVKEENKTLPWG